MGSNDNLKVLGVLILSLILLLFFCQHQPTAGVRVPEELNLEGAKLIETFGNGAKRYRLSDGSVAILWSDGSWELTLTDETVIQSWIPRGKQSEIKRITHSNGEVESYFADGTKVVKKGDVQTISFPDGRIMEIRADGSIWETSHAKRTFYNPQILEFENLKTSVSVREIVEYKWRIKPTYSKPWISLMSPDEKIENISADKIERDGDRYAYSIKFDNTGRYKLEIIAFGRYGEEIAANVEVWCGVNPPANRQVVFYPVVDEKTPLDILEKKFWAMVNEVRRKRNLAELRWDSEVAQLARSHARDMSANDFFGHISPSMGNLARRAIREYGWRSTLYGLPTGPPEEGTPNYIADVINKTASLADAIESLLDSPAHRRVLLFPYFTSCGVGVCWSSNQIDKSLLIVTAFLQENRDRKNVVANQPIRVLQGISNFRIFGRDDE